MPQNPAKHLTQKLFAYKTESFPRSMLVPHMEVASGTQPAPSGGVGAQYLKAQSGLLKPSDRHPGTMPSQPTNLGVIPGATMVESHGPPVHHHFLYNFIGKP